MEEREEKTNYIRSINTMIREEHPDMSLKDYTQHTRVGYDIHGLLRQMRHFLSDMSNRVEHQKRNQTATEVVAVWFRFWCSTRLLMSVKKCVI